MRNLTALFAIAFSCAVMFGSDWPTDGGNPQRTNWQKDETILRTDNVGNLKILWKLKFDNAPRQMHALLPPLIIGDVRTSSGSKQIALTAGVSDNLYAIDADKGEVLWKKHFEYPPPTRNGGALWGRTGAAIDSNGVAWAPTGDGTYDLPTQRYGNGLIGAKVEGNELKLKDW